MMDDEPEITIVREPQVYLVGKQVVNEEVVAEFLDDHEVRQWTTDTVVAGEKLIEIAGRLCYMSFAKPRPGGNQAYISHILEVGHGSVLEHSVYNFIIAGVSRSFTHELVRHRAGFGFSQLSQRFVNESECQFIEPDAIANDPELHKVWLDAVTTAQVAYRALADGLNAKYKGIEDRTLRRKKAREAARSVLPNATETRIFVTANGRALRHFIEMRADPSRRRGDPQGRDRGPEDPPGPRAPTCSGITRFVRMSMPARPPRLSTARSSPTRPFSLDVPRRRRRRGQSGACRRGEARRSLSRHGRCGRTAWRRAGSRRSRSSSRS